MEDKQATKQNQAKTGEVRDMTKGIYRLWYGEMRTHRSFNNLSVDAALCYAMVHTAVDDFGNVWGDDDMARVTIAPRRREWDDDRFAEILDELDDGGFIQRYEAGGEAYIHITGFLQNQPAPRNGRRVRKFPAFPPDENPAGDDDIEPVGNPGESGGIQNIPDDSECPHTHTHAHSHSHIHTQPHAETDADADAQAEPGGGEGKPSKGEGVGMEGTIGAEGDKMLKRIADRQKAVAPDAAAYAEKSAALQAAGVESPQTIKTLSGRKDITAELIRFHHKRLDGDANRRNIAGSLVNFLNSRTFTDSDRREATMAATGQPAHAAATFKF